MVFAIREFRLNGNALVGLQPRGADGRRFVHQCLIGIDLQGLSEGRNDTACPEECGQNKFL